MINDHGLRNETAICTAHDTARLPTISFAYIRCDVSLKNDVATFDARCKDASHYTQRVVR